MKLDEIVSIFQHNFIQFNEKKKICMISICFFPTGFASLKFFSLATLSINGFNMGRDVLQYKII